jgi:signal peptidase I
MQSDLEYFDDADDDAAAKEPRPSWSSPADPVAADLLAVGGMAPERESAAAVEPPRAERLAMAWPPSVWERPPEAWRTDAWAGPEPFVPYDADPLSLIEIPADIPAQRSNARALARELVETIVLTVLIFFGIRLLIQNFKIEGSSMEPTLHSGQYLLVNKFAYRGSGEPQRGDIVVFKSWTPGKDFIKRVVGTPGDTVAIHENAVWINGERLDEAYLDQITTGPDTTVHLADDQYFVMGDNRGNSSDSRNNGALQGENIIGKAWFTYWPPGEIGFVPSISQSHASN